MVAGIFIHLTYKHIFGIIAYTEHMFDEVTQQFIVLAVQESRKFGCAKFAYPKIVTINIQHTDSKFH